MIARTAKDMDVLIESLPGEEAAPELQVSLGATKRRLADDAAAHECRHECDRLHSREYVEMRTMSAVHSKARLKASVHEIAEEAFMEPLQTAITSYKIESSLLLQANNLQRLEIENNEAAVRLQEVVMRGECLLAQVQKALAEIASQQLSSKQQTPEDSSGRTNAPPNFGGY